MFKQKWSLYKRIRTNQKTRSKILKIAEYMLDNKDMFGIEELKCTCDSLIKTSKELDSYVLELFVEYNKMAWFEEEN